ncbi:MAG: hypothetical protein N4A72_05875 [Bacteroidales bacterium]|jgi:hypothetical protein|nr:hypothetical protein [Bacteroidales bacterium]
MLEKQKQEIGDNSTGIQVQGDLVVGTSYTDIRAIFLDLFQLNFPKVQEIASITANERVDKLLDEIKNSFEEHKDEIDIKKFEDPSLQYEMQLMAINAARRGEKSNLKLLAKLLCVIASKNCSDLNELITSEALKVVPLLNNNHIQFLSFMSFIILEEKFFTEKEFSEIENDIKDLEFDKPINLSRKDYSYLISLGLISHRGTITKNSLPPILSQNKLSEKLTLEKLISHSQQNDLVQFIQFLKLLEPTGFGVYNLQETGNLIGRTRLSHTIKIN